MYQHQIDATETTWPDADPYPVERLAARAPHESEGAEARSTNEETPDRL